MYLLSYSYSCGNISGKVYVAVVERRSHASCGTEVARKRVTSRPSARPSCTFTIARASRLASPRLTRVDEARRRAQRTRVGASRPSATRSDASSAHSPQFLAVRRATTR